MRTEKKGILNVFYGVLLQLVTIGFAIVTPILVIENYGSETNGLLHSCSQIFIYLSLFEAGVGSATLQALYGPVAKNDSREISAIMVATKRFFDRTGLFYTIGVVVFSFLYPVVVKTSLSYFFVVGIILFGGLAGSVNYFYQGKYILLMQVEGYSYISTKINIVINILTNIIKVILLVCGCNVLIVQFSTFVLQLIRALCYHIYIRKNYNNKINFSVEPDYKAISQKNSVFVHQIAYLIFSSTDIMLLTLLTQNLKLVSVYTLYSSFVSMLFNLIQQISGGFDFKLGQIFAVDKERYHKQFYHLFEIFHLVIAFTSMSTLYIVFLPFMKLYTHNVTDINYINELYPLLFILVPLLTHGRTAASSSITFAGHFKQTKSHAIIESTINLVITVVGIITLGLPGALLGTIIASIYRTIVTIWYYYKYISPGSAGKTIRRWIYCFGVFSLIVLFDHFHPVTADNYFTVILTAAGGGIAFLLIYSLGQYLINPDEREQIRSIIKASLKMVKNKIKARPTTAG